MKLQKLLSYVRKCCDDYTMIEENDKIAVGVSGGKDSLTLLIAMKEMQRFFPKKYQLEAITVSLGLPGFDLMPVKKLCDDIGVNYTVVETDIGAIVFDVRKERNPCSLCAKMRKGALHDAAISLGCNKIALGHNKDDVIHTFFLSLFYEGRINTFSPVTYLDRKDLRMIRPLIYVPEREVRDFVEAKAIHIVKSPCSVDGKTKREEIKKFVTEQSQNFDHLEEKVFGAIQRSSIKDWQ